MNTSLIDFRIIVGNVFEMISITMVEIDKYFINGEQMIRPFNFTAYLIVTIIV